MPIKRRIRNGAVVESSKLQLTVPTFHLGVSFQVTNALLLTQLPATGPRTLAAATHLGDPSSGPWFQPNPVISICRCLGSEPPNEDSLSLSFSHTPKITSHSLTTRDMSLLQPAPNMLNRHIINKKITMTVNSTYIS